MPNRSEFDQMGLLTSRGNRHQFSKPDGSSGNNSEVWETRIRESELEIFETQDSML